MKIRQFFTEANDRLSMMRLLSWMCILSGCAMAFIYPDYEVGYLGLVTLGFGGKATQKTMEVKNETKTS